MSVGGGGKGDGGGGWRLVQVVNARGRACQSAGSHGGCSVCDGRAPGAGTDVRSAAAPQWRARARFAFVSQYKLRPGRTHPECGF